MLFFESVGLFAGHSSRTGIVDQLIFVKFDHYLLVLLLLLLDTDQLILMPDLPFCLLGDVVVGEHLNGLVGCDFRGI